MFDEQKVSSPPLELGIGDVDDDGGVGEDGDDDDDDDDEALEREGEDPNSPTRTGSFTSIWGCNAISTLYSSKHCCMLH